MDQERIYMTLAQTSLTLMRFQMQLRSRLTTHQLHCLVKVTLSRLAIEEKLWTKMTLFKPQVKRKDHLTKITKINSLELPF